MKPLKSIVSALAALGIISVIAPAYAAPQIQNIDSNKAAADLMRLNNNLLKSNKKGSSDIWERTRLGFQIDEVNPELVRKHEQYYATRVAYFNRTLDRGSLYMHFILSEVEKRGIPTEIALLPVIESAFVTKAQSHVGASGLWQFMPATGTQYGLEQTWWYDGRRDVYESTLAALDYLEYLYKLQGDWSLALASYNWGEGRVKRAVNQARAAGLDPVYENLRMPDETRNYVPKLLAVRNIINNPESFGLQLKPLSNSAYFTPVAVNQHMDISLAARFAEMTEQDFRLLNPGFNLPVYAHKNGRQMLLPVGKVKTFKKNLNQWGNKPLLSWDIYTAQGNENLAQLASSAGMSITELKEINGVRGNNLQAGRPILLANNPARNIGIEGTQLLAKATPSAPSVNSDLIVTARDIASQVKLSTRITPTPPVMVAQNTKIETPALQIAQNTVKVQTPVIQVTQKTEQSKQNNDIVVAANTNKVATAMPLDLNPSNNTITLASTPTVISPSIEVAKAAPQVETPAINETFTLASVKTEELPQTATPDPLELFAKDLLSQQATASSATPTRDNIVVAQAETRATPKIIQTKPKINTSNHQVERNETLTAIAKQYGMKVNDLISLNGLDGETIQAGAILKVAANKQANNKVTNKNTVYVVQKGDSWYSIARKFGLNHEDVQRWNARNTPRLQPGVKVNLIGL